MMDIKQGEITKALESLGNGNHQLKDIENQIVIDRHNQKKLEKTKRRNKKMQ